MKAPLRALLRAPTFTLVATVTLALGIGANTAVFSVADTLLFKPLPYEDPSALVVVRAVGASADESVTGLTMADLADYKSEPDLFAGLAGWKPRDVTFTGRGTAERMRGAVVTAGMFSRVLRVQPVLGRSFLPEEDRPGGTRAVLLEHDFWQRSLGGGSDVLGRAVTFDGVPYTVVGVMPRGFIAPFVPKARFWIPAQLEVRRCRGCDDLSAIGRLTPGMTLPVAHERAEAVSRGLAEAYPVTNAGARLAISGLEEVRMAARAEGLRLLFAVAGIVLLVACANVACLVVARGSRLIPDLSLRNAIGAGPSALRRTVLIECAVLEVMGGTAALAVASWGTDFIMGLAPEGLLVEEVPVDGRVLLFNLAAALCASIAFALWPTWSAGRRSYPMPGQGGAAPQSRSRAEAGLVVAQVAFAMVLTGGAAVLIQGLEELRDTDVGFEAEGVLALSLPATSPGDVRAGGATWREDLLGEAAQLPGVVAVATTSALPLLHEPDRTEFTVRDRTPLSGESAEVRRITGSYTYVMGLRLTEGRSFSDLDQRTPVQPVMVNEAFARTFLRRGAGPALGSEIALGRSGTTWHTVIGVVRNVRASGPKGPAPPAIYMPPSKDSGPVSVVLKTDVDPLEVVPDLRSVLNSMVPGVAPLRIAPMTTIVEESLAHERFVAALLSVFALLALTLAGVGIYGVLHQRTQRRRTELGVRLALGADRDQITDAVVRGGVGLTGVGIALGGGIALGLAGALDQLVEGAASRDPGPFLVTAVVLVAVALAASWLPARKAAAVDPVSALRNE